MIYGYARVSTQGQDLTAQTEELKAHGCEVIYAEKYTGTKSHRPELEKLLAVLEPGDTVIVTKLDRVARSTTGGIEIIDRIVGSGAALEILNMGKFDSSPVGKLMRTMMLGFAEFERDMIVQRTQEGKAVARLREGYKEGRPRKEWEDEGSWRATSERWGISRSTYYRRMRGTATQSAGTERTSALG